jgi:hypothetical protein
MFMRTTRENLRNSGHSVRRNAGAFIVPLFLALAALLGACGTNGGTTGNGSTSPTPTPTQALSASAGRACPNTTVTNPPAVKPNVIIKLSNSNRTVAAHTGDLIEVLLPNNEQWSGPTTSQGILQLQSPSGYPLQTEKMCVWHFLAQGAGTTTLNFTGRAICRAGQPCPMYVIELPFKVVVN